MKVLGAKCELSVRADLSQGTYICWYFLACFFYLGVLAYTVISSPVRSPSQFLKMLSRKILEIEIPNFPLSGMVNLMVDSLHPTHLVSHSSVQHLRAVCSVHLVVTQVAISIICFTWVSAKVTLILLTREWGLLLAGMWQTEAWVLPMRERKRERERWRETE